jgi:hypothetical protein
MNDESERIWKKAVVSQWRCYDETCYEVLGKTTKGSNRMDGVSAEVRIGHLQNATLKQCVEK